MKKQLFFDDMLLFGRDNVQRRLGEPEVVAEFNDGITSTDFCTGSVFKLPTGKYRMLYFGHSPEFKGKKLFVAQSEDGIHFSPEAVECDVQRVYPNEIMTLLGGTEIASIFEDEREPVGSDARYKMLLAVHNGEKMCVDDLVLTSPDLIHWTEKNGVRWGQGTEPLASTFYNKHKQNYTVVARPFWGVRAVGCSTTRDWESFSDYRNLLDVDALDPPLAEIYGMYAFEYDGMYIGMAHIYGDLHSEYNAKYKNGRIDVELAYSYDGEYWRRGLREPFITGGEEYPIKWIACAMPRGDEILLYGTGSRLEHGPAFSKPGSGNLFVYRLRRDGFISLAAECGKRARVITREKIWLGGEVHINARAKNLTVAVYETGESQAVGNNVLGMATPLSGFGAEDMLPFSGDAVDFVPEFKGGKIDSLKGKTLVFEICYEDGELYSLGGDYVDVFNTEGARFRKFGVFPKR